jgi:P pilus assembly chaperone PapD
MFSFFYRSVALLAGAMLAAQVQAGIVLNTTRVIYGAQDKEVSFGVHNTGSSEILLQSWLESAVPDSDPASLPFVVLPGLARMPGDGKQLLRIIHAGSDMPQDRESVLWLNVQEIPQVAAENALQVAIRQRIKVFFRPRDLPGNAADAPGALRWRVAEGVLHIENPEPYHVSMVQISTRQGASELLSKDSQMIAPKQSLRLPLERRMGEGPIRLSFISINDFGAQVPYRATLTGDRAAQASKAEPR